MTPKTYITFYFNPNGAFCVSNQLNRYAYEKATQ